MMKLATTRISIPVLIMMLFQSGYGVSDWFVNACRELNRGDVFAAQRLFVKNNPSSVEPGARKAHEAETHRRREEARRRVQELTGLGGNPSILNNWANGSPSQDEIIQYKSIIARADTEIARLRREAEQRIQQEEARAKQEAERLRQEEEARAKKEEELLKQQEEERRKQEAEVQQRMRDLENLGGNPAILNKFANGTCSPEEIIKYRAALNRADAEIARLKREAELDVQYE